MKSILDGFFKKENYSRFSFFVIMYFVTKKNNNKQMSSNIILTVKIGFSMLVTNVVASAFVIPVVLMEPVEKAKPDIPRTTVEKICMTM